jgi:3-oxoacyl-[acyl-carrier protein] reductase
MDLGLKGLRAAITGGSKGIGRATALTFAAEGCGVAICARTQTEIDQTVADIAKLGVPAFGQAVDVKDKVALTGWVERSAAQLGGLDILICNVSALDMGAGEEAWRAEFEIDLLHTVRAVEAALPYLEASAHPAVIAISSVSGLEFDFTSAAYGTFKAAVIHYASRMASALAEKRIRVNTVSPGNTYFKGGIWHRIERDMPDLFKQSLALNPFGRMATDQEIANAAVFLASPASSFTTGVNLVVDGALTRRIQY